MGLDPFHSAARGQSVFGRGRRAKAAETAVVANAFTGFRRTERDARPPRRVLTARLLGDPAPGRTIPPDPDAVDAPTTDKPIFLTFREMRAYYGDPETE